MNQGSAILGKQGEVWGQEYYKKLGFVIVGTNEFNRKGKQFGEIDFVALKGKQLVFVEVKTRRDGPGALQSGVEAVHVFKQQRLIRAMHLFLMRNPRYREFNPQIDVCVVLVSDLDKGIYRVILLSNAVEDWN